ncbi:MAG TPA: EAL domain-containing protein [Burkholderiales bacterium]|jgi:diguanylate cyclase (GGDEF)-like protein|nr:EAL domain-containing protein [Burkholderiales bacterium]
MSGGDPRQAVRLRRFLLGSAAYAICIPLVWLASEFNLIARGPALVLVAIMIAVNLGLYAVFRSGLNRKFSDPSLTWLQVFIGNVVVMYAVYSFDQARAIVLNLSLVVLSFGMFRFTTREFVKTALQILAAYAAVINLLMYFKPETVNVYQEWFQWAGLAAVLPLFAAVGGRISLLRQRLRASNEELRSALGNVRQMATHDHLTGLPNRLLFNEELQRALARAERHARPVALFFMDLDRFKNINDTLGHQFGDRVLQEAAKRLAGCVREGDIIARLGGDEFVLLVEELGDPAVLTEIARKLLAALSELGKIDGQELSLTLSIGICVYPVDGRDSKTLLAGADIAMYRAKDRGRNGFCFYSAELQSHTPEKLALEAGLRHALERGEFRVYYQPKIDMATGAITGVEALLRWQHPEKGLLLPEKFIQLAEESGLIVAIGLWTLREVCMRAKAWRDAGLPRMTIAVNLSASQFLEEKLVSQLAEILKSTGTDAGILDLEITESMVMRDPDEAVKLMHNLRAMGVGLTIDDFGTGYSSLGYLKNFPINSLKVDRSFVRDLAHSSDDVAITRAVIAMAHSLQMNVIAEGVELREQFDVLREEGCDEFQGYLCRPPLAEDDLIRFVRDCAMQEATG